MSWQPGVFIATPQDAEEFGAAHLRDLGYHDATRTPTGPDGGVDIYSSRALGQVKQIAAQVGRPDIQRLVGARGRDHHLDLVFYSATGYSRSALEYADHMDVALFTYDLTGNAVAVNRQATAMVQAATAARVADAKAAKAQAQKNAEARRMWAWIGGVLVAIILPIQFVGYVAAGIIQSSGKAWGSAVVALIFFALLWLAGRNDVRKRMGKLAHPIVRRIFLIHD